MPGWLGNLVGHSVAERRSDRCFPFPGHDKKYPPSQIGLWMQKALEAGVDGHTHESR